MKTGDIAVELTAAIRKAGVTVSDEGFNGLVHLVGSDSRLDAAAVSKALDTISARKQGTTKSALARRLLPYLAAIRAQWRAPETRILIVTALPLEFGAVMKHMLGSEDRYLRGGVLLSVGTIDDLPTCLVGLIQTGQTNAAAAQATAVAIAGFSPAVVVFVGIAGGRKSVKKGDVVVASSVYQLGHVAEGDQRLSREKSIPASQRLVQVASRLSSDDHTIKVGPLVAGDVLLKNANSETAAWVTTHHNDALAVEMEGWGFAWTTHAAETNSVVIRGISDLIDDKDQASDDTWQPIAAANAANAAIRVLQALVALEAKG